MCSLLDIVDKGVDSSYSQLFTTLWPIFFNHNWKWSNKPPCKEERASYYEQLAKTLIETKDPQRIGNIETILQKFNREWMLAREISITKTKIEKEEGKIFFNAKSKTNHIFSNFFPTLVYLKEAKQIYFSAESAYLSQNYFPDCPFISDDALKLKKATQKIKKQSTYSPVTPKVKKERMEKIVFAKFEQNPELMKILLQEGKEHIFLEKTKDAYWGVGEDGKGENVLGNILTSLANPCRVG